MSGINEEILKILKQAFEALDVDKSGFIEKSEFIDVMKGSHFKEQEIIAILDGIDTDKDGKINFKEFCEAFRL